MVLSVSSLNVKPRHPCGYRPVAGDTRRRRRGSVSDTLMSGSSRLSIWKGEL